MTTADQKNKIDLLVRTCRMLARMNRARPETRKSQSLYYQMMVDYYTRVNNAHQEGKKIASHTVFFPTEILYAMDIVPMHTEMTTWLIALFLKEQAELLEKGAEQGLVPEICSPHRGVAGIFATNSIPRPDVILWSNLICDNTAKSGELMMELSGSPGFFLDNPFRNSPGEIDYLVGELQDMVSFLEEQTGQKMDWNKLSEMVERTRHEIALYREIGELRKAVPSPMNILGYLELLSADYMYPGQPEATQYLTLLRDELKEMVEQGKGAVSRENFRLMTLFIPPMHLMTSLARLFDERGAVSVVEPLFTLWSEGELDPDNPLRSVAIKSFMIPERRSMYGPLDQQALDDITESAEKYKTDGAIYWAFMGCRHTCATIKVIKETLSELDVPMLTIDCDIVDPTITSEEEATGKIEQFFELLEDR
ncbi:MAG TPA: 2-hydroxyacyl-CoA dehydratase [Dehalococcoidia bacterium]|nr:2-hydroxyacyl-CoA dehydratase [Dehalococcoidia bacterium]